MYGVRANLLPDEMYRSINVVMHRNTLSYQQNYRAEPLLLRGCFIKSLQVYLLPRHQRSIVQHHH